MNYGGLAIIVHFNRWKRASGFCYNRSHFIYLEVYRV